MITTALFDIDGVITKKRTELHSKRYAREYDVSPEEVKVFFETEFPACLLGEADLKEVLTPYLRKWNWDKTVEEFLQYWFTSEPGISEQVLAEVEVLRNADIECYLASEQEKYRAAYLLRLDGLVDKVDGAFFTCIIGHRKATPEFYEKILKRLSVEADDVIFWDDDLQNIKAAQSVGITAHFYDGFLPFKTQIADVLGQNKN